MSDAIPDAVRAHYADMLSRQQYPEVPLEQTLAWIDHRRKIGEEATERFWFKSSHADPNTWWAEAVPYEGEYWVVRQVSLLRENDLRAYDWTHRHDEEWGFMDGSIDYGTRFVLDSSRDEFEVMWNEARGGKQGTIVS